MDRLTKRDKYGEAVFVHGPNFCPDEVCNRLAYYEDLEEQGRLVVLEEGENNGQGN